MLLRLGLLYSFTDFFVEGRRWFRTLFFLCLLMISDPAIYFANGWSLIFFGETFLERLPISYSKCFLFDLLVETLMNKYLSLSLDFLYKVLLFDLFLLLVLSRILLSNLTVGFVLLLSFSYLIILLLSRLEKFFDRLLFLLYVLSFFFLDLWRFLLECLVFSLNLSLSLYSLFSRSGRASSEDIISVLPGLGDLYLLSLISSIIFWKLSC